MAYLHTVPADCIFCAIARGDAPAERVHEDERTVAFMDINPATHGHALVIPRAHCQDIFDADPADVAAVATTAQILATAARDSFRTDGINIVQASGAAAFQTVFHLHFHVIPRYHSDRFLQPWIPSPGNPEEIKQSAARLREALRHSQ